MTNLAGLHKTVHKVAIIARSSNSCALIVLAYIVFSGCLQTIPELPLVVTILGRTVLGGRFAWRDRPLLLSREKKRTLAAPLWPPGSAMLRLTAPHFTITLSRRNTRPGSSCEEPRSSRCVRAAST